MDLKFRRSAKILRDAVNSGDQSVLFRLYPQNADSILMALQVLSNANNLNEVMKFAMFRPHVLQGCNKDTFSMSVGGRKRLLIKTLDSSGKVTKKINFSSTYGLVVEVSEHYGD